LLRCLDFLFSRQPDSKSGAKRRRRFVPAAMTFAASYSTVVAARVSAESRLAAENAFARIALLHAPAWLIFMNLCARCLEDENKEKQNEPPKPDIRRPYRAMRYELRHLQPVSCVC
jgi:hypothetical protein